MALSRKAASVFLVCFLVLLAVDCQANARQVLSAACTGFPSELRPCLPYLRIHKGSPVAPSGDCCKGMARLEDFFRHYTELVCDCLQQVYQKNPDAYFNLLSLPNACGVSEVLCTN